MLHVYPPLQMITQMRGFLGSLVHMGELPKSKVQIFISERSQHTYTWDQGNLKIITIILGFRGHPPLRSLKPFCFPPNYFTFVKNCVFQCRNKGCNCIGPLITSSTSQMVGDSELDLKYIRGKMQSFHRFQNGKTQHEFVINNLENSTTTSQ